MRRSTLVVISAALFSAIGMLAGYLGGRENNVLVCAGVGVMVGLGVAALAIGVDEGVK